MPSTRNMTEVPVHQSAAEYLSKADTTRAEPNCRLVRLLLGKGVSAQCQICESHPGDGVCAFSYLSVRTAVEAELRAREDDINRVRKAVHEHGLT